jgi:N4-gp56 family major capsid protein
VSQTTIPVGHPLARKIFGAAVFAEYCKAPSLSQRLTGPAPKLSSATATLERMETDRNYPIVRITDLSKGGGDTIQLDAFNLIEGIPTMGDRKLTGRMMDLSSNVMTMTLNQCRGGIDAGGRMTQHRTEHDLRTVGRAALAGWYARFADQVKLVHMAGARGDHNTKEWVVPLSSHAEFAEIMVNSVLAPTYNRHFYAGQATSMATFSATDYLTLDDLDKLRASIDEMDVPMQPVQFEGDASAPDSPMYVLLVPPRVYHNLVRQSSEKSLRLFQMNARERSASNPLFRGEVGMWNGIMVKKVNLPIRFNPGTAVTVATSADTFATTTSTVPADLGGADVANYAVERCILLGSQGLAEAFGKDTRSGTHFNWHEETSDHDNCFEASIAAITGYAKLRFASKTGATYDNGICVIDSVAPDPSKVTLL